MEPKALDQCLTPEEVAMLADPSKVMLDVTDPALGKRKRAFSHPKLFEIDRENPLTKGTAGGY